MPLAEAIDTTRIPRVAGRRTAFVTTRPCRAPHHTIADVGLRGDCSIHIISRAPQVSTPLALSTDGMLTYVPDGKRQIHLTAPT